jgi:hypothetical protein
MEDAAGGANTNGRVTYGSFADRKALACIQVERDMKGRAAWTNIGWTWVQWEWGALAPVSE